VPRRPPRPDCEAAAVGGFQDTARIVLALLDAQDGKAAEGAAVLDVLASFVVLTVRRLRVA